MIPCYSSRSKDSLIPNEEYFNNTFTTVKKMQPPSQHPMTSATDHSQRIGKLLPYISSMVSTKLGLFTLFLIHFIYTI